MFDVEKIDGSAYLADYRSSGEFVKRPAMEVRNRFGMWNEKLETKWVTGEWSVGDVSKKVEREFEEPFGVLIQSMSLVDVGNAYVYDGGYVVEDRPINTGQLKEVIERRGFEVAVLARLATVGGRKEVPLRLWAENVKSFRMVDGVLNSSTDRTHLCAGNWGEGEFSLARSYRLDARFDTGFVSFMSSVHHGDGGKWMHTRQYVQATRHHNDAYPNDLTMGVSVWCHGGSSLGPMLSAENVYTEKNGEVLRSTTVIDEASLKYGRREVNLDDWYKLRFVPGCDLGSFMVSHAVLPLYDFKLGVE